MDPTFDFTRNLFDNIHKNARAIVDPENFDLSPLTPLSEASSPSSATPLGPSVPASNSTAPCPTASVPSFQGLVTQDGPPLASPLATPPNPIDHASSSSTTTSSIPVTNSLAHTGSADQRSRQAKRKAAEKVRSKLNAKRKKDAHDAYTPSASLENKHFQSAKPAQTTYSAASFPITSKGFTSLRAKNRSSSHYLAELVGPESKYKFGLRKWDGR